MLSFLVVGSPLLTEVKKEYLENSSLEETIRNLKGGKIVKLEFT